VDQRGVDGGELSPDLPSQRGVECFQLVVELLVLLGELADLGLQLVAEVVLARKRRAVYLLRWRVHALVVFQQKLRAACQLRR